MSKTKLMDCKVTKPLSPEGELVAIKRTVAFLRTHPDALREVLMRAGIVTVRGKLTKAFGG